MCLMLDQFLWGHSSRVCDISCFFIEDNSQMPFYCAFLYFYMFENSFFILIYILLCQLFDVCKDFVKIIN